MTMKALVLNKIYLLFITAFAFFVGCVARETLSPLPPEDEFARAQSYFEHHRYDRAIAGFERIIFYHPSSELVDDAQYLLARAYFAQGDFAQAITEFDYLIKNFPTSPFVEDAEFYQVQSYIRKAPGWDRDQTETEDAVNRLDEFLTRFPNSKYTNEIKDLILSARNRLARKELENGKLYVKLKELKAAEKYFRYVLENYPETKAALETKFQLAGLCQRRGRNDEALTLYKELLENPEWKARAEKKIRSIENKK
jgi:outer membrane protein assembly factor BamD